jgi:branched-chain amino acid transport system substrate-binding protein
MFSRMLMATITALATLGGPASAADHIKLGYMATLSGPFAMVGEEQQRGLNLALEELGNKLGGAPVTLSTADDKGSPPEAVAAAAKLIEQDNVEIVTGMMNSATTIATMKAYENAGVFIVSALSGPLQYAGKECHPNAFFASFANDEWDTALGRYMTQKGVKSTYMIGVDNPAGRQKLAGAQRTFKGQVFGPVFTPLDRTDFSAELAQIRAAKPESIYVFYPVALAIPFLKQFAQSGIKATIYSEDTTASELSFPAEGAAALGVVESTSWSADLDNPANRKFVAAFIKKYGRRPTIFAALQYDAIKLLDHAVTAVKGKVENKDAFRAALRKADFHSIRGPFRFNNNHFPIQNVYISDVEKDGRGGMKLALKAIIAKDWQDDVHQQCPMKN